MHIISYKKIKDFSLKHSTAGSSLNAWYRIISRTNITCFQEIKAIFPNADWVNKFIVFNIGGNKFRLIAYPNFDTGRLFIRHILTHPEYDKGKWKEDEWFTNN